MKFKFDQRLGRVVGSKTEYLQKHEIEELGGVVPSNRHINPGTGYIPEKDLMNVKMKARQKGVDLMRLNGYDKDIGGALYRFERTRTFESKGNKMNTRKFVCESKRIDQAGLFDAYVRFAFDAIEEPGTIGEICQQLPWRNWRDPNAPDWNDYVEEFDECIGRPSLDLERALSDASYCGKCFELCKNKCREITRIYNRAWGFDDDDVDEPNMEMFENILRDAKDFKDDEEELKGADLYESNKVTLTLGQLKRLVKETASAIRRKGR